METICGGKATAVSYAKVIEDDVRKQIARMCDYEFATGSR